MPHLGKKMNPAFARWVLHLDASDFPKFRPCLSPRITCSRFHTVDSVLYRTPYTADLYSYYTRPKRVCQSLDGVFRFFKKEKISRSKFKPYRLSSQLLSASPGGSLRSSSRSDPGSFQNLASALGPRACEFCVHNFGMNSLFPMDPWLP